MLIPVAISIVAVILFGSLISMYNSLIRLKNNIEKAWANIDVLLKQRSSEIPNLVATVKGYAKHEKQLLETITKLRTSVTRARSVDNKAAASANLSQALKTLFAVAENYPDLKANANFLDLQNRISELEDIIADRREFYNDSVTIFNMRIEQIPYVFIARPLGFSKRPLFEASPAEATLPQVSFEVA